MGEVLLVADFAFAVPSGQLPSGETRRVGLIINPSRN